jgi:hypothetical protein
MSTTPSPIRKRKEEMVPMRRTSLMPYHTRWNVPEEFNWLEHSDFLWDLFVATKDNRTPKPQIDMMITRHLTNRLFLEGAELELVLIQLQKGTEQCLFIYEGGVFYLKTILQGTSVQQWRWETIELNISMDENQNYLQSGQPLLVGVEKHPQTDHLMVLLKQHHEHFHHRRYNLLLRETTANDQFFNEWMFKECQREYYFQN